MGDGSWRKLYGRLRLGAIVYDTGEVVPLDWRDLMWAVRAVRGEVGFYDAAGIECDAVLWTMTNRLRVVKDMDIGRGLSFHRPPHRLHHLLLAYCAPINPEQRDKGDERTRARRAHYAAMDPWDEDIYRPSIARVAKLLRGGTSRLPYLQYVDFAQCDCEGCGRDRHGIEDMKLGDCFWIGPAGRALDEGSVYIAPPRSRSGGLGAGVAAALLGTAGLAVAFR